MLGEKGRLVHEMKLHTFRNGEEMECAWATRRVRTRERKNLVEWTIVGKNER